jgi:hypothetical protein
VKVSCKDPKEIKGASKVYFNNRGFMVSWLVETEKTQNLKTRAQPHLSPRRMRKKRRSQITIFLSKMMDRKLMLVANLLNQANKEKAGSSRSRFKVKSLLRNCMINRTRRCQAQHRK